MAFSPIRYESGRATNVKQVASTTITKGDALAEDGNGFYQRATNAATLVRYVAMEGSVAGAGENPEILVMPTHGVQFEADTNADPVQTDVGTTADLTDHDTLNESASSNDVFFIEEIVGAASDKKVRGYFLTDKAS